jgi:acetoin:2,6-dichlorophenolindophenol oxidoreductase subunit beta
MSPRVAEPAPAITGGRRIGSFRQAINEALHLEMARDERVIVLGEDVAGGATLPGFEEKDAWGGPLAVTRGLVKEFGRARVLDTPVSETGFIGAAVGAAATGMRPVVELTFLDFLGVCMDQVVNQAAKMRYMLGGQVSIPIVIRTMIGAGDRMAGQHSGANYSVTTHFPGLKTVVPSCPADAKGLMLAAIRDDDPVVFCEHRLLYSERGPLPEGDAVVPLGTADVKRAGDAVTVVAIGRMVQIALASAQQLEEEGISVEVVDPRTLSPLDLDTILTSVAKTRRLVVVDEDNPRCSVAADIVAQVVSSPGAPLASPPQLVTAPHCPVPFSPPLEDAYLPGPTQVTAAVRRTAQ